MGKNVFGMKSVDITAQLTHGPNVHPYMEPSYLQCFFFIAFWEAEHEGQTGAEL